MKPILAEGLGTFAIVFTGTGAMVVDSVTGGGVTHIGVALAFGVAVAAMILAFKDVSGAHLNPAVTLALCAAERFPARKAVPYVAAQCLGAIAASLLLRCLFPSHPTLGSTVPAGSDLESFGLEAAMTFALMLVILGISARLQDGKRLVALAAGAVVGLEAFFGGPISGASMNPARSMAPALVTGELDPLWIYIAAPTLGALLAVPACKLLRIPGCCTSCEPGRST